MKLSKTIAMIGLAAGSSLLTTAAGAAEMSNEQMAQELKSLKHEVAQLRAQQGQDWMNEARAEQVKSLVREVLADADTRASLLDSPVTAGYGKKGFFLSSEDGTFFMNIGGQLQVRYVANSRNDNNGDVNGFEIRRAKVWFQGTAIDPKLSYKVQLVSDRTTGSSAGSVYAEDLWIGYQIADNLKITGGRFQDRFSREGYMSSKKAQTVDRSLVVNIFADNDNFVEGLALDWQPADMVKIGASFNDGIKSGNKGAGFSQDGTDADYSFSGRVDVKLAGDWKNSEDAEAWSDPEGKPQLQAFIGGGVHYQDVNGTMPFGVLSNPSPTPATNAFGTYDNLLLWTVDGLAKWNGMSIMAAGFGMHTSGSNGTPDFDSYGATVQAGVFVIPDQLEAFGRYEWISPDSAAATGSAVSPHDVNILTFGGNYFFVKHNAKFTADVVWVMDPLDRGSIFASGGSTGIGLLGDTAGQDNQVAFRAQFQLLF